MTPILRQLRSWQARERAFSASVAAAAVALVAAVGVSVACLIDYFWDGWSETPFAARVALLVVQVVAYLAAAVVAFRMVRPPSLVSLASRAEGAFAEFDHRLVTALQLNRPTARTDGMSPVLITAVTDEAIDLSARRKLDALTDPKRLLWAALLLLPVLVIAGLAFGIVRPLAVTLLQRQLLLNVDIPRSVTVENATPPLFPAGDAVRVRVKVIGPVQESTTGELRVTPANGRTERYTLTHAGPADDGSAHYFTADLPPATESFTFVARVLDGRMRTPAEVRFEPRPVVTKVEAWVLAPAYVDPDGKRRFETPAPQGEVVCHPDCSVRVRAEASKPIATATLVLAGKGVEHRLPLELEDGGTAAGTTFTLPPGVNGYRIEVADEHGFANLAPPRRGVSVLPDRPPSVTLNDELLMPGWETGPPDDYEVRGMPLVLGGQIQIGYQAKSGLGVARPAIIYRVNDGPWTLFPLTRTDVDEAKAGRFRPELGVFDTHDVTANVEFYPLPSADPDAEPGGLTAGGRYNFLTAALVKVAKDGTTSKLIVGDRVEFRVAVYDRKHAVVERALALIDTLLRPSIDPSAPAEFAALPLPETPAVKAARSAVAADPKAAAPALRALRTALQPDRPIPMTDTDTASRPADERVGMGRPAGYSESRLKAVVTEAAFQQWRDQQARSRERLREIEKLQQGVFGEKKK